MAERAIPQIGFAAACLSSSSTHTTRPASNGRRPAGHPRPQAKLCRRQRKRGREGVMSRRKGKLSLPLSPHARRRRRRFHGTSWTAALHTHTQVSSSTLLSRRDAIWFYGMGDESNITRIPRAVSPFFAAVVLAAQIWLFWPLPLLLPPLPSFLPWLLASRLLSPRKALFPHCVQTRVGLLGDAGSSAYVIRIWPSSTNLVLALSHTHTSATPDRDPQSF